MTIKLTKAEERAYADLARAAKHLRQLQRRKVRLREKRSPKGPRNERRLAQDAL